MRTAECKDCLREVLAGLRPEGSQYFTYPEAWANLQLERGGSRSDRCRQHRASHLSHISGVAVAYIDLETIGEVADRDYPSGPLGALGPLPPIHETADTPGVDLGVFGFGMDETHIVKMLDLLADPKRRVLVVKAGTGTGKSTYMPYKLLDPPANCFRLTELGPIVVTEPRVQATVGVASFVGTIMSGSGGVGPGYPVGYQVSGDRQHDSACQLIYVTDGTMINWLREGRLSTIGTVIVDEAHERSTNIDFILGYLRRELDRYPHLRVIITSATFDAAFYQQYFGGPERVGVVEVPAVKSIGYGWPLFPELDARPVKNAHVSAWKRMAPELRLAGGATPSDLEELIARAWPRYAPPLKDSDVVDPGDAGYVEDLHATTRALMPLRFTDPFPASRWGKEMPAVVAEFVVQLCAGLDERGIFGDILAFLPTSRAIDEACNSIRASVAGAADVYALVSSLPAADKELALAPRRKGDRRKIVVSTNLAETSLTVEGVRFVVDSGLIAQSDWDVDAAQGSIKTKPHSQAGIKQRWGRVGRKAPGWVFPLYGKEQLLVLAEDTAPGSTRENLESLVITAKLGGLASLHDIVWPAAFEPVAPVALDPAAEASRENFVRELERAEAALRINGALDSDGDPTNFGRELTRLQVLGSAGAALAVMYADRLACVPEVTTILALLNGTNLVSANGLLLSDRAWPDEWRLEAAERHRALASGCEDDAELILLVVAGWERADPDVPPWHDSQRRADWAAQWWINHETLLAASQVRRDVLAGLSPAMKEEAKRLIEPALLRRARGAITRAFANLTHHFDGSTFSPESGASEAFTGESALEELVASQSVPAVPGAVSVVSSTKTESQAVQTIGLTPSPDLKLDQAAETKNSVGSQSIRVDNSVLTTPPQRTIPLSRKRHSGVTYLANFVSVEPWALETDISERPGHASAIEMLSTSARHARPEMHRNSLGALMSAWPAGTRARLRLARDGSGVASIVEVEARHSPARLPAVAEELAEIDASEELAHETGTPDDAAPERDIAWPTANDPIPDSDAILHRSVLDYREFEANEFACEQCVACLAGNLTDCSDPRGQGEADPSFGTDSPTDWAASMTRGIGVSTPAVRAADADALKDFAWYEVVGYDVSTPERPALLVRPDWRRPEHTAGPGEHPDLIPGGRVEVVVGGTAHDHDGLLRVFYRSDGNGRFLLREADRDWRRQVEYGQLAISLGSRDTGQLHELQEGAVLVAVALPRSENNHFTITLLDLAYHHVEDCSRGVGQSGNGRSIPAVIVGNANSAGYADAQLLARDTVSGLRHVFSVQIGTDDAFHMDAPVLIDLRRATAQIPLQGRPLTEIRSAIDHLSDVRLAGLPTGPSMPTVGGGRTRLESAGLVSRSSARQLSALALDETWARDVWFFWARSRHQNVIRVRPGAHVEWIDQPAKPGIDLPAELLLPADQIRRLYPVGTQATAVVTSVNDDLRRAWLRLSDGVPASIGAKDVPGVGNGRLSSVLYRGREISGVVLDVFTGGTKPAVTLTMADTGRTDHVTQPQPMPTGRPGAFQISTQTDPNDLAIALRARGELAVSFEGVPAQFVTAYAAYLLGLAFAVPAGRAEWTQPQQLVITWPHAPLPPPTVQDDRPDRHRVNSFDQGLDSLAREVRLGRSVEVDLRGASPQVGGAVRLFLAGLTQDLAMNLEASDSGRMLHVYRR